MAAAAVALDVGILAGLGGDDNGNLCPPEAPPEYIVVDDDDNVADPEPVHCQMLRERQNRKMSVLQSQRDRERQMNYRRLSDSA